MRTLVKAASGVLMTNMLAAGVSPADASAAAGKDRNAPNVVFFLIDDMGWRDLGCFGSTFYETPNIDALALSGVRFTDAYASCHVSSPSRASLMTGMYPASLGMTDWLPGRREYPFQQNSTTRVVQDLPHESVTIAETMRDNGYATAIIGKWHIGETGSKPQEHGFDIHIPDGFLRGWPDTYYAPFKMNGFDGEPGEYLTDRLTDEALEYICDNKDRPFFLMLSHFAVHDPVEGRKDLVEKYKEKLRQMPESALPDFILEGNPDDPDAMTAEELTAASEDVVYAGHRILPRDMVKIKQIQDNVHFAAMVESVDESVGRVLSCLDSLSLADNTIIVFFSDNGGMSAANFGNPNRVIQDTALDKAYSTSVLPLRGGKGWMYEGGLRVPLIIRWPGHGAEGKVCDVPVGTQDMYATLVEMTGVKSPESAGSDGVDISPLLKGRHIADREMYWHFPHYSNHAMTSPAGGVRKGPYKLIEYYDHGSVQLFDLSADLEEKHDLSDRMPEKVEELKGMLAVWRDKVGALMPEPNLAYSSALDAERYIQAAPAKFWPCEVRDKDYADNLDLTALLGKNSVTALELEYERTMCRATLQKAMDAYSSQIGDMEILLNKVDPGQLADDDMRALLVSAIDAVRLFKATADEQYRNWAQQVWKTLNAKRKILMGDDCRTCLWNILASSLFELNANGRNLLSMIPPKDKSSKWASYWDTVRYTHTAGEYNNALSLAYFTDVSVNTGKKFGSGIISMKKDPEGVLRISFDSYRQPYVYAKYPVEVLVGRKEVADVRLNGKSIKWKVNNRGFVIVSSHWKEDDILEIVLN